MNLSLEHFQHRSVRHGILGSTLLQNMWQSQIEIEYYSVVYFERITEFDALEHYASMEGGAHMHFIDVHAFTYCA